MDCFHECRGRAVVVAVRGKVDEASWAAFGTAMGYAIDTARENDLQRLILDLSALEYMSSRGLRVLTIAKRDGDEAGISIALASPNEVMREILEISRYDRLFTVTDTVDAAQPSN